MKSRLEVVALVRDRIRLRHYSLNTEYLYCWWIGHYYDFCRQLPAGLAPERKIEAFLSDLAVRKRVAARTQNQAFAAILFLYREVLAQPLGNVDALRAKNYRHERTAPSPEQVRALRAAVTDRPFTPARLLVDLLYGCGLRVSEPLELRIKDVLWHENQLVIRAAKGAKDRRVPLPKSCLAPLRAQVEFARGIWKSDRDTGPDVGVALPFQLARKYPSAPFSWSWFWVFPARAHCQHPRSRETVRFHLLHDALQRAVHDAAVRIGLEGFITPHVLRHAYATHSREPIETLRQLMGHNSIETTSGYRHATVDNATNPLDDLVGAPPRAP
ncbi:MAG TPA: tyrosine-type recombinase/integrase [Candidatus Didemnitutus sp.]